MRFNLIFFILLSFFATSTAHAYLCDLEFAPIHRLDGTRALQELSKTKVGTFNVLNLEFSPGKYVYNPQTKPLVTYLPQVLDFPSNITVNEIIDLVSTHYQTDYNFLNDLLEQLELKKLLKRKTSALSGGEKRKLGLVCTLLGRPQFAMLDEPTANIDVEGCVKIEEILKNYFNQNKTSLLFSSHQMQEVENLADKIVILKAGEIITQGQRPR